MEKHAKVCRDIVGHQPYVTAELNKLWWTKAKGVETDVDHEKIEVRLHRAFEQGYCVLDDAASDLVEAYSSG